MKEEKQLVKKSYPNANLVIKKDRQHIIEYYYIESEWDGDILGVGSTEELAWIDANEKLISKR